MQPDETHNEQTLLSRLRDGDERALQEIYLQYWDRLFVTANNRLKDQQEAEEVVQDVFFSLWKRRASLELRYQLITYLSVAVKYQVINRQARAWYKAQYQPLEEQHRVTDSTAVWFAEKELRQQLEAAIDTLPEKCRIVFRMSREEGKSNAQVAEALGVSEKNVEAHITRALNHLRGSTGISLLLLAYLLRK